MLVDWSPRRDPREDQDEQERGQHRLSVTFALPPPSASTDSTPLDASATARSVAPGGSAGARPIHPATPHVGDRSHNGRDHLGGDRWDSRTTVFVIALLVAALVALFVIRAAMQEAGKVEMYCPHCGIAGIPRTITKGSTLVEVMLWFAGLLPGLIYSLWLRNSRHAACPSCHQAGMIPANSPRALDLKRKMPE